MNAIETKLLPRVGKILHVLCIARISGDKQDPRSLDDQVALIRNWLRQNYEGTSELKIISGIGSGERLDRKEVHEASDAIESGQFDLVIMEDLGRAFRRVHAILLCELCVDCGRLSIILLDTLVPTSDVFTSLRRAEPTTVILSCVPTEARARSTEAVSPICTVMASVLATPAGPVTRIS